MNKFKLEFKLLLFISCIFALIFFTFIFGIYLPNQKKLLLNSLLDKSKLITGFYFPLIVEALETNNDTKIITSFQNMKKDPDITYIRIIDNEGKILKHNRIEEWGKPANDNYWKKIANSNTPITFKITETNSYDYSLPILSNNLKIASLSVGISCDNLSIKYSQTAKDTLKYGFVCLLAGIILYFICIKLIIIKPLKEINNSISSVLLGKIDEELEVTRSDEFGKVSENINKLIRKLTK